MQNKCNREVGKKSLQMINGILSTINEVEAQSRVIINNGKLNCTHTKKNLKKLLFFCFATPKKFTEEENFLQHACIQPPKSEHVDDFIH